MSLISTEVGIEVIKVIRCLTEHIKLRAFGTSPKSPSFLPSSVWGRCAVPCYRNIAVSVGRHGVSELNPYR